MNSMIIYFLPTLVALGIITSYEDLKEGKIRNKYLISAAAVTAATHVILVSFSIETLSAAVYQLALAFFAFCTAVFIYILKWWSAGDAKLFTTYAFMIPAAPKSTDMTIIITLLLILMVIPIWLVLLVRAMIIRRKKLLKIFKDSLKAKEIISTLLVVLSLPWLIKITLTAIGLRTNILLSFALIILISGALREYAAKYENTTYLAILGIRIIAETQTFLSTTFFIKVLPLLAAYYLARGFISLMMLDAAKNHKTIKQGWIMKILNNSDIPFAPIMFIGAALTLIIVSL